MNVVLMTKDVALAIEGPLAVASLATKLTVEIVDAMMAATSDHRVRYPDGGSMSLTLLKPNVALPDESARKYIQEVNKRPDSARFSVVVIDAPGFWAAGMRGILAGMALVSSTAPRGAGSVADALQMLAPKLPGVDLVALAKDIANFRAKHLEMSAAAKK